MHLSIIETEPKTCNRCGEPAYYVNEDYDGPMQDLGATFCKAHGDEIIAKKSQRVRERHEARCKREVEDMLDRYKRLVLDIRSTDADYEPPFRIVEG